MFPNFQTCRQTNIGHPLYDCITQKKVKNQQEKDHPQVSKELVTETYKTPTQEKITNCYPYQNKSGEKHIKERCGILAESERYKTLELLAHLKPQKYPLITRIQEPPLFKIPQGAPKKAKKRKISPIGAHWESNGSTHNS